MTPFHFMANAFFVLVGVGCAGLALVIVYAVVVGIIHIVKEARENGNRRY